MYKNVIQGVYTLLASGVSTATQVFTRDQIVLARLPSNSLVPNTVGTVIEATGLLANLNITAVPGVDTVQLVLEEIDPLSGVVTSLAASTATAVTGMVRLKMFPAITAVAASTAGVTVQDILPANWRIRVVHSAASNFTYSLGVTVYA